MRILDKVQGDDLCRAPGLRRGALEGVACKKDALNEGRQLNSNKAKKQNYNLSVGLVSVKFRPNMAPRPAPTGQARKIVQNAPKISTRDKL
jgi:hypothetical protein